METIICATDFSPYAENATRYASELAQLFNARIILFHSVNAPVKPVVNYFGGIAYTQPIQHFKLKETQEAKLERVKQQLQYACETQAIGYESTVKQGLVKDTISETILEEQADLVVLGTEKAAGLEEILEGAVSADVVMAATCPVLIVPQHVTFKPLRTLVFATDLKGEQLANIGFLIKMADLFEVEIKFLHVVPQKTPAIAAAALEKLQLIYGDFPYPNISFHVEEHQHIEEGISQFTCRHKADMLVIGYHPRRMWKDLFTSYYEQVVAYHTFLPMLILPYQY